MNFALPPDALPAGPDAPTEVVEALVAATVTTFHELTSTEVSVRGPVLLSMMPADGDVNAMIELRRHPPGRLTCSFPRIVLETLAKRYLPPGTSLTAEILDDTAGEFTNVIAGQAKTILKGSEYHYLISPPVVYRGPAPMSGPSNCDHLLLILDSDAGPFGVQFRLSPSRRDNSRAVHGG